MNLFVFGLGYTSLAFLRRHGDRFAACAGTVRSPEKAARLAGEGIEACPFPAADAKALHERIAAADAILVSTPPDEDGDPALARFGDVLARSKAGWIGYLSTVGVYGDHGGGWVDEKTPLRPVSRRSRQRVEAEQAWLDFGAHHGKAVHLFRLAGIYGPGRNPMRKLAEGRAQRIVKPGQVFNRIHVDDIAAVLIASIERPRAAAIYNVADDEPAPPQDVVAYAAALMEVTPPPEIAFAEADLSPMARSFYGENKRVRNGLIRSELGVTLAYPTYREGLTALLAAGEAEITPRDGSRSDRNGSHNAG